MPTQTRPAEPLLASQILRDADLDNLLDAVLISDAGTKKRAWETGILATGVKSVDESLNGGLRAGKVVSVSAEVGDGGEVRVLFPLLLLCFVCVVGLGVFF